MKTLLILILVALLAAPVVAVSVTFDNATCGIHVTMDIPANENGQIEIPSEAFVDAANKSRCNETPIIWASTHEYVKQASSYCAPGYCGVPNVTVVPTYTTKAFSYNVDEPITYPQEYYTKGTLVDTLLSGKDVRYPGPFNSHGGSFGEYATILELRRQTILMEKQNELLQEQVNEMKWQRNSKLTCAKWADMHYGQGCQEYAWVGGA